MLKSTGSHRRGVERRLPEMRLMVEFNCLLSVNTEYSRQTVDTCSLTKFEGDL